MAKITITADTQTGSIEAMCDDKKIEGIMDCNVYSTTRWDSEAQMDKACCGIEMRMRPVKESGMTYYMTARAAHQLKDGESVHGRVGDDIVILRDSGVVANDIAKALRSNS